MRLITFNLQHDASRWQGRFPLVISMLQEHEADVIALQEVALNIHQEQLISEALQSKGLPYQVELVPKWKKGAKEGLGILSRIPILETDKLKMRGGGRVAQRVSFIMGERVVDLVNTHLHHLPPYRETLRLPQVRSILEWMGPRLAQDIPAILTGDFNAQPESSTIKFVKEALISVFEQHCGEEVPNTFPTPLQRIPLAEVIIDYVFVTSNHFKIKNAFRIGDKHNPEDKTLYPSDHYGLLVDIELENE